MLTYEGQEKSPAVIKVVGVGGAGMNAVERMVSDNIVGVEIISMNTDEQVLRKSSSTYKMLLGSRQTKGLGAGARPEVGEEAALEDKEKIHSMLSGADMVFITAGLGGGTGTGASPIIAEIAKEIGALTVGVVSVPFTFEGARKSAIAKKGLERLREHVDTLIVMPNDFIFRVIDKNTSVNLAFKAIDDVLAQSVIGISQIINSTGYINVDFADVRTVMENNGDALIGVGKGTGEERVLQALNSAIHHPLLEGRHIDGASSILINIVVGEDFTMQEYSDIQKTIYELVSEDAQMIVGFSNDASLDNSAYITVIATGFQNSSSIDIPSSIEKKSNLNSSFETSKDQLLSDFNKNYAPLKQQSTSFSTSRKTKENRYTLDQKKEEDLHLYSNRNTNTNTNHPDKDLPSVDIKTQSQEQTFKFPMINQDMDELDIPTFLRNARTNKV